MIAVQTLQKCNLQFILTFAFLPMSSLIRQIGKIRYSMICRSAIDQFAFFDTLLRQNCNHERINKQTYD